MQNRSDCLRRLFEWLNRPFRCLVISFTYILHCVTLGSEGTMIAVLKDATGPTNSRTLLTTCLMASSREMDTAVGKKQRKLKLSNLKEAR